MWVARCPELRSWPIRMEESGRVTATTLEEIIEGWTAMLEASRRDYEGHMEALEDARKAGRKAFDELLSPYLRALGEATYDSKSCFRECHGGVARRNSASSNEAGGVVPLPCVRPRFHGRDTPCTPVMEQAFPRNETERPGAEERFAMKECLRAAYECCDPQLRGEYRQRDPKRAGKAHEDFEQEYYSWNDYTFAKCLFVISSDEPDLVDTRDINK